MVAQVVVDIAHPGTKETYDYNVPEELNVEQGSRIAVPFGRMKKQGYVLSLSDESEIPSEKLRSIERVLDPYPVLRDEDIEIARYLAHSYHMPMAQAIRTLLPSRLRENKPAAKQQDVIELVAKGDAWDDAISSAMKKDGSVRYPKQIEVLKALKDAPDGILRSELPASAVRTLLKKGYVRVRGPRTMLAELPSSEAAPESVMLVPQQSAAVETILGSEEKDFLLHGVTGSGKTEVYIRVVQQTLEQGKGAIILVPEIALTPQVYEYLRTRLRVPVALFHSKLTEAERFAQWEQVRLGSIRVVLGPRSAIFAPVSDLGAVIIDEEHETSYKSGRYPGYTAKEIARFRAHLNDAYLILGSATPSLETYKEATEGQWRIISMPDRLFKAALPPVEVIDMRREIQRGNPGIISEQLDAAIRRALAEKMQTIILLNRRGYSSFLMCTSCGTALGCDNCDVSMTYHKSEGMLKCHYCGERRPVPNRCPVCGGSHLRRVGIGTQQLEEQLHDKYPSARILRMDADTMGGRSAHENAYQSFKAGEADILIGTQMIAKGFDFEKVSVAAVVAADTMLHLPDYRSAERTFAQITQLAGRAGRRTDGHVYIQTYSPEHYAITHAASHDYNGFFAEEAAYRCSLHLPPYGEHIVIRFASENESRSQRAAKDFLGRIRVALEDRRDIIIRARASESPIKRVNSMYRYQILVHLRKRDEDVEQTLYELLSQISYDGVLAGIDVNPIELY